MSSFQAYKNLNIGLWQNKPDFAIMHHKYLPLVSQTAYVHYYTLYTPHHTLRSANQRFLEQPQFSTELDKRSFSCLAPNIWNNLPPDTFSNH